MGGGSGERVWMGEGIVMRARPGGAVWDMFDKSIVTAEEQTTLQSLDCIVMGGYEPGGWGRVL
jgi:hypothetical protein